MSKNLSRLPYPVNVTDLILRLHNVDVSISERAATLYELQIGILFANGLCQFGQIESNIVLAVNSEILQTSRTLCNYRLLAAASSEYVSTPGEKTIQGFLRKHGNTELLSKIVINANFGREISRFENLRKFQRKIESMEMESREYARFLDYSLRLSRNKSIEKNTNTITQTINAVSENDPFFAGSLGRTKIIQIHNRLRPIAPIIWLIYRYGFDYLIPPKITNHLFRDYLFETIEEIDGLDKKITIYINHITECLNRINYDIAPIIKSNVLDSSDIVFNPLEY